MELTRREFLKVSGGMAFAFSLEGIFPGEAQAQSAKAINAWVRIAPDGTVIIYSAGAEMGQGSSNTLALIVAEEMDADWDKVKIEFAPADASLYGYMWTPTKTSMMSIV